MFDAHLWNKPNSGGFHPYSAKQLRAIRIPDEITVDCGAQEPREDFEDHSSEADWRNVGPYEQQKFGVWSKQCSAHNCLQQNKAVRFVLNMDDVRIELSKS